MILKSYLNCVKFFRLRFSTTYSIQLGKRLISSSVNKCFTKSKLPSCTSSAFNACVHRVIKGILSSALNEVGNVFLAKKSHNKCRSERSKSDDSNVNIPDVFGYKELVFFPVIVLSSS